MSAEQAIGARRLIVLAPIEPAATGNGLAMRTELFRSAAAEELDVQTVVVPVAGRLPPGIADADRVSVVQPDPRFARVGLGGLAADAAWRERLTRCQPLPSLARAASPGLADGLVRMVHTDGPIALHVMRSYLAPLGAAVAERLGASWLTLDLDEDDGAFCIANGDRDEAAAFDRLLAVFGPVFDGLSIASPAEAEALARRHGLAIDTIPNAIAVPTQRERRASSAGEEVSLLFVGNLTYGPNVEAAVVLVDEILPRLQEALARRVRITLVGAHSAELGRLAGLDVELTGFVADLGPYYASADVVVVPLQKGAGTRIKLLEAFAYGVPVVASATAAAGLDVSDGRELLLATDPERAAAAVRTVLESRSTADSLVAAASRLVRDRYSTDVVAPQIRAFFKRAADRAGERLQLSGSR